jgi:hypothetical protein
MNKIKFLIKAILKMNYKEMFNVARKISREHNRLSLITFIDIVWCGLRYGAGYMDYLEFEFYLLNGEQRKTFLTRAKNNEIVRKYNNKEFNHLLNNKIEFNNMFKDYLERDFIDVSQCTKKEFKQFCKGKKYVIAKEVDNCGGVGVSKEFIQDTNRLYEKLKKNKQYLVEEVIVQNSKVSKLYPDAVNTLRLFTFLDDNGEVQILNSIFKIGNKGFVDNFASGGMYTFLDDNGEVICPAIDKKDNRYSIHPETKEQIIGFKVPNYEKAIELVKEASKLIPEIRYIGWDVAITEKGACLVEGNEFPGVFQIKPSYMDKPEGILPRYNKYMK